MPAAKGRTVTREEFQARWDAYTKDINALSDQIMAVRIKGLTALRAMPEWKTGIVLDELCRARDEERAARTTYFQARNEERALVRKRGALSAARTKMARERYGKRGWPTRVELLRARRTQYEDE